MFQTKFSLSAGFPESARKNIYSILSIVDQCDGLVYGSLVHKTLSKLNYHIQDIDILFASVAHMNKFCTEINNYMTSVRHPQYIRQDPRYIYKYSEYLSDNAVVLRQPNGPTIRLDLNVIDMETCAPGKSFVEFCANEVLKLDFLKNVYYKGVIYHKLQDVVNVNLANFCYSNTMRKYIQKYTYRGVKMTLVDTKDMCAPSKEALSVAKDTYRDMGLVVIPLNRNGSNPCGKCPAVPNWQALSTKYNFEINERCDNIGIVCGPASGIVCIDVDVKDDGLKMFNKMALRYRGLETTPTQKTGNGGYHFIFKYNHARMSNMKPKIKCPKLDGRPIGIDMWIQDCQFVAAPSVNYSNGKSYKWIKEIESVDKLTEMPEWLYELYHTENIDRDGLILSYNDSESDSGTDPDMPGLSKASDYESESDYELDYESDESELIVSKKENEPMDIVNQLLQLISSYKSKDNLNKVETAESESESESESEAESEAESEYESEAESEYESEAESESDVEFRFDLNNTIDMLIKSINMKYMILFGVVIGIPVLVLLAICVAGIGIALMVFGIIASTMLIGGSLLGAGVVFMYKFKLTEKITTTVNVKLNQD